LLLRESRERVCVSNHVLHSIVVVVFSALLYFLFQCDNYKIFIIFTRGTSFQNAWRNDSRSSLTFFLLLMCVLPHLQSTLRYEESCSRLETSSSFSYGPRQVFF
jgi:hypothetical protein